MGITSSGKNPKLYCDICKSILEKKLSAAYTARVGYMVLLAPDDGEEKIALSVKDLRNFCTSVLHGDADHRAWLLKEFELFIEKKQEETKVERKTYP